jgi:hypothetical protein
MFPTNRKDSAAHVLNGPLETEHRGHRQLVFFLKTAKILPALRECAERIYKPP